MAGAAAPPAGGAPTAGAAGVAAGSRLVSGEPAGISEARPVGTFTPGSGEVAAGVPGNADAAPGSAGVCGSVIDAVAPGAAAGAAGVAGVEAGMPVPARAEANVCSNCGALPS
ncbi:hypothetical protein AU196_14025 [Mycobacterium sp. IS-1742]|nr:hypothetical protein AU196_14025 [Mycobacterium sp. IS-1742]